MAKKPSRKDPHRDIPKDADGNPIFADPTDGDPAHLRPRHGAMRARVAGDA